MDRLKNTTATTNPLKSRTKLKYKQGHFNPANPSKYQGSVPIVYRSSWELRVMQYLDSNPAIKVWMSESIVIKYISPADQRWHRYFVDFAIIYQKSDGTHEKALIEIKPNKERKPPRKNVKNPQRFLQEMETYEINQAKWKFAEQWCKERGIKFMVLDEYDIGLKQRPKSKR